MSARASNLPQGVVRAAPGRDAPQRRMAPDRRRTAAGRDAAPRMPPHERGGHRAWLVVLGLLIGLTFALGRTGYYTSGDTLGYNLGLAGGITMLVLLVYPLRKHVRFMRNWGGNRYWFAGHMVLGIVGPLLVLAHTTFHVGSTNALVALVSMLLVAGSGVIGRFIYARIHSGLYGERSTLRDLQATTGLTAEQVHANLGFLPAVEQRIRRFESNAMPQFESLVHDAARFVTLGTRRQWVYLRCAHELRRALRSRARERHWDEVKYRRRSRVLQQLVRDYLAAVQRVSQFSVYEKIFSLWHMLHVPLVYLLVLSAIAHVVAVTMY